jgi:hypothetical protein
MKIQMHVGTQYDFVILFELLPATVSSPPPAQIHKTQHHHYEPILPPHSEVYTGDQPSRLPK